MEKLKILIADNSVIHRKAFSDAVADTEYGTVLHTASNGSIALEWLKQSPIDVVLLDVSIHGGSLDMLKTIKTQFPDIEVIVLSDYSSKSAAVTFEALESGALDFILKAPENSIDKHIDPIKKQLQILFTQIMVKKYSSLAGLVSQHGNSCTLTAATTGAASGYTAGISPSGFDRAAWKGADLILIASSTGGPVALDTLCSMLPRDFDRPVLIVQHMPPEFTGVLAQTLAKKYDLRVAEGKDCDLICKGQIFIAPGGMHMVIEKLNDKEEVIRLENTPYVNGVRPAADVLFQSVAKTYKGRNILAVILTGMGNDGTKGIGEIKEACNCYCITQSEDTCVVYGMPRCVYEAGLSDEVVALNNIAGRMCQIASGRR